MLKGDWSFHFTQLTSSILGTMLWSASLNLFLPLQPPSMPSPALTLTLCNFYPTTCLSSIFPLFPSYALSGFNVRPSFCGSSWVCCGCIQRPGNCCPIIHGVGWPIIHGPGCHIVRYFAVWMAAPSMVVASTMVCSRVQLLGEEELLFWVGRGPPSYKNKHHHEEKFTFISIFIWLSWFMIEIQYTRARGPTHMETRWPCNDSYFHI